MLGTIRSCFGGFVGFWFFINHWWNLPYLVILGLVAVFFVLQLVGMLGVDGDAGDHDQAADVHDGPEPHGEDVPHEAGGGSHAGSGAALGHVLSFLGVGQVPLMAIWVTFFLFVGFTGIAVNRWLFESGSGTYPFWGFPLSVLAALSVGVLATRFISRLVARVVDTAGRGATAKHELVGHLGTVASASLDAAFGEVRVKDLLGNEMIVHAQLTRGDAQLKRGDRVVLTNYDAGRGTFEVAAVPEHNF